MINDQGYIDLSETTGITPESSNKINPHPQTTTHILKTGWSKKICSTIAKSQLLPAKLKDATTQRSMIIQFLAYYFSGNIDPHYNLTDVILFIACLIFKDRAKTAEDLVWGPDEYASSEDDTNVVFTTEKGKTVDLTPPTGTDSKITSESKVILITISDVTPLAAGVEYNTSLPTTARGPNLRPEDDLEALIKIVSPLFNKYNVENLKTFFDYCDQILQRSSAKDAPSLELIELCRLLNFVALTMLRATIKTKAQMATGFLKKQYKTNIITFVGPNLGERFVPPCSLAVAKTVTYLNKTNKQVSCIFAKLLMLSITAEASTKSRLDAAVLTHTSWHGLGILQMLFNICEFFSKTWIEVYQLTILTCTASSWKSIFTFMTTYQQIGDEDPTVPWARVIDDAYLAKYNPQNHPTLAAIFKRSLEYAQGRDEGGIDNAVWAQKHHCIVEKYHTRSEWLLSQLNQEEVSVQAGHKESRGLATVINASQKVTISHNPSTSQHMYDDI